MFKKNKATSVKEYLAHVPEDRKEIVTFLHEFIQKAAPSLKPHFAYNMIGYGKFKYKNYMGEIIDWPTIALADQKSYVSVYACAAKDGEYIAEKYKDKLGNVNVGKSCIRIKKLEHVDLKTLEKVIKAAEKAPGFVGAGEHKKK